MRLLGGAPAGSLGPPSFFFEDHGREARAAFTVSTLTPDVAAFTSRLPRKRPSSSP